MDKREYALSILKQARKLLTDRLIESIADSADGILEDAEGCSYMDEIEAVQEKIGGRLASINMLIASIPAGDPADQVPKPTAQNPQDSIAIPIEASISEPANFALFSQQIAANNIEGAGQTLSEILDVDQSTGLRCATSFQERLNEDPNVIKKATILRAKLKEGENNDSLMILWDCFRLQGLRAVEVLQTLKTRHSLL